MFQITLHVAFALHLLFKKGIGSRLLGPHQGVLVVVMTPVGVVTVTPPATTPAAGLRRQLGEELTGAVVFLWP